MRGGEGMRTGGREVKGGGHGERGEGAAPVAAKGCTSEPPLPRLGAIKFPRSTSTPVGQPPAQHSVQARPASAPAGLPEHSHAATRP